VFDLETVTADNLLQLLESRLGPSALALSLFPSLSVDTVASETYRLPPKHSFKKLRTRLGRVSTVYHLLYTRSCKLLLSSIALLRPLAFLEDFS
jgi:hypothetical protein